MEDVLENAEAARKKLSDFYGNPAEWRHSEMVSEWGYKTLYRCPRCEAVVFDPYQHKAWHLQGIH